MQPHGGFGGNTKFPGIGISLVWIVVYFALQVIVSIPVMVVAALLDENLRDKLTSGDRELTKDALLNASGVPIVLGVLLSGLVMLLILWAHLRKDGRQHRIGMFARSRLPLGTTIGYGIGLMVAALIFGAIYNVTVLKGRDSQADTEAIVDGLQSPIGVLVGFLAIVVVGPIVEELLFRGYLQTALGRHMKPWMSIAISACIFGAIHLQPLAFPVLAALGAVLGYLYHRTGSLKVNIALHIANNALAFSALVLAGSSQA